eukprot:COSAG01_NODE_17580_length_1139_cov_1.700000_2_plen_117_part_00
MGELDSTKEINLRAFLSESFTVEDFVHVKMDIENCEWEVLESMLDDGSIGYIDELTVELHFTTDDPAWQPFLKAAGLTSDKMFAETSPCHSMHTREEAVAMLKRLREHGVYAHTYP